MFELEVHLQMGMFIFHLCKGIPSSLFTSIFISCTFLVDYPLWILWCQVSQAHGYWNGWPSWDLHIGLWNLWHRAGTQKFVVVGVATAGDSPILRCIVNYGNVRILIIHEPYNPKAKVSILGITWYYLVCLNGIELIEPWRSLFIVPSIQDFDSWWPFLEIPGDPFPEDG
jgi:hypothetical protein